LNLRTYCNLVPSLRMNKLRVYLYFPTGLHFMQSDFIFILLKKFKYCTKKNFYNRCYEFLNTSECNALGRYKYFNMIWSGIDRGPIRCGDFGRQRNNVIFFFQVLTFPLSVSFHQCSIPIFHSSPTKFNFYSLR
jgi:hypothetical protein